MKYFNIKDDEARRLFVEEVISNLGEKYIPLRYWSDDLMDDMWAEQSFLTRRLALWNITQGVLPEYFWKAKDESRVFGWDHETLELSWMTQGFGLPQVDLENPPVSWKDAIVVYKVPMKGKLPKSFRDAKQALGAVGTLFVTEHELFTAHMSEMSFTNEDITQYLLSIGGVWSSNGEINISIDAWTAITVMYDEVKASWFYREGATNKRLRRYHSLNGVPIGSNTAFLLALGYLMASPNGSVLRGRRAYMSEIFADPIYTGFAHPIVDESALNKLGCIDSTFKSKGDLVLVKASTLVESLLAYRSLGYSTFMHKGGKFGVVDAGFMGFGLDSNLDDVSAIFADKPEKALGRMLALVPTAAEFIDSKPSLSQSNVAFRNKYGKEFKWYGVRYYEAAVLSPLVEEGSGELLEHPNATRDLCEATTLSYDVVGNSEEEAKEGLIIAQPGDILAMGQPWLKRQNLTTFSNLASWTSPSELAIKSSPVFVWNPNSNTLHIKVEGYKLLRNCIGEKARGSGKASGNGGFTREIRVELSGTKEVIFDPNQPLHKADNSLAQVERVVGAEEFKTSFYIMELVATANNKVFVWDESNLCWDNQEEIESLIEGNVERVDVYRGFLNPRIYSMFKALYKGKDNWLFDDNSCSIVHKNAMCWRGYKTQIIEVPTVSTFAGRCAVFAEQYTYIGTEFPLLYNLLLQEVERNRELLVNAITMATAQLEEVSEILTIDVQTEIVEGERLSIELEKDDESGITYVKTIFVPAGMEYNTKFLFALDKAAKANGFKGYCLFTEGHNADNCLLLDMKAFAVLGGSAAQPLTARLFELFRWLEYDLETRETTRGYDAIIHRLGSSIRGQMESMLFESDSIFAKATKTTRLAITGRARSTISACVKDDEVHFHSKSMQYWGLEESDTLVWGRVPVPGVGISKVVRNDKVQPYTAMFPAGVKHEVEEGDVDGDSFLAIVISDEGKLKIPTGIQEVNPLSK